jgi:hypothetical protein
MDQMDQIGTILRNVSGPTKNGSISIFYLLIFSWTRWTRRKEKIESSKRKIKVVIGLIKTHLFSGPSGPNTPVSFAIRGFGGGPDVFHRASFPQ